MIDSTQVVTLFIPEEELHLVRDYAKKGISGGSSAVRPPKERTENLDIDQLVGMVGAYAACKLLFGSDEKFRTSRYYANIYKFRSDGGSDIPGTNIDVKSSLWRYRNKPVLDHHLIVSPEEYNPGTVYVGVMVTIEETYATAYLMGWHKGVSLKFCEKIEPGMPEDLIKKYYASFRSVNPLMPLVWWN